MIYQPEGVKSLIIRRSPTFGVVIASTESALNSSEKAELVDFRCCIPHFRIAGMEISK